MGSWRRRRYTSQKPINAPEIWPMTVAAAAPATPRSRTKMKIGSRIRLRMAPEPCTIMKPAGRPMA